MKRPSAEKKIRGFWMSLVRMKAAMPYWIRFPSGWRLITSVSSDLLLLATTPAVVFTIVRQVQAWVVAVKVVKLNGSGDWPLRVDFFSASRLSDDVSSLLSSESLRSV
jgi:hypothetical protein